jgi:hypothetical protein
MLLSAMFIVNSMLLKKSIVSTPLLGLNGDSSRTIQYRKCPECHSDESLDVDCRRMGSIRERRHRYEPAHLPLRRHATNGTAQAVRVSEKATRLI